MACPGRTVGLVMTLILVVLSGRAAAQDAMAASLEELLRSGSLRPGLGIYVTDTGGRRWKGDVRDVSSTMLTVTDDRGGAWSWSEGEIDRIEQQDSLENGAWIGLAAGVGVAYAACKMTRGDCSYTVLYIGYPAVAVGAFAGLIVDAVTHRTLYNRAGSADLRVSPMLSSRTLGARMSVAW